MALPTLVLYKSFDSHTRFGKPSNLLVDKVFNMEKIAILAVLFFYWKSVLCKQKFF